MRIRAIAILAAVMGAAGATCSVNLNVNSGTPLDDASAIINIRRISGQAKASVEATIRRGFTNVNLSDEQEIAINGVELQRTGSLFVASVDAATSYTLTVQEPTRGINTTNVVEPGGFDITSPSDGGTASLSGFTVEWTNAQAGFLVEISITQNLLGSPKSLIVGPLPDSGSLFVPDSQLASAGFGQGAPMSIAVSRIAEVASVSGFASGVMQVRLTKSVTANAGP